MSMRSMYVKVYDFVNIALKENLCIHTQTHTYTLSCLHFFKQNLAYKNVYIYAGPLKFKFLFQVSIKTWFWAVSVISFNGRKVVLPSLVVDVQACKVLIVQLILKEQKQFQSLKIERVLFHKSNYLWQLRWKFLGFWSSDCI